MFRLETSSLTAVCLDVSLRVSPVGHTAEEIALSLLVNGDLLKTLLVEDLLTWVILGSGVVL